MICGASSEPLSCAGRMEFHSPKVGGLGLSCCWMGKDEGRAGIKASPGEPSLLFLHRWGGTSATSPHSSFQGSAVDNAKLFCCSYQSSAWGNGWLCQRQCQLWLLVCHIERDVKADQTEEPLSMAVGERFRLAMCLWNHLSPVKGWLFLFTALCRYYFYLLLWNVCLAFELEDHNKFSTSSEFDSHWAGWKGKRQH